MAEPRPAKAKLIELDPLGTNPAKQVTVQFNPETLKVTYTNQIETPKGEGNTQEKASLQYVATGTTKLSVQIWFDVTGEAPGGDPQPNDVRVLTADVAYFILPRKPPGGKFKPPPSVRFDWGTFRYEGVMESLEESLEFFSSDGVPLRASMTLSMVQQRAEFLTSGNGAGGAVPPGAGGPAAAPPGTQPLTAAPAGATVQGMVAAAGGGLSWQGIAAANGIENPRLLTPGQLVNLNVNVDVSASASIGVGASAGFSASASVGVGASAGASASVALT